MGGRVSRVFRNFNLENRVHREISRDKPRSAPKHPLAPGPARSEGAESVNEKSAPLLDHLRSLYVQSTDPEQPQSSQQEGQKKEEVQEEEARRPLQYSIPGHLLGMQEITDVPKGRLTLPEAVKALNSHQLRPAMWTVEKIAQEYTLELKDCKDVLDHFSTFSVRMIPKASEQTKRIKDS